MNTHPPTMHAHHLLPAKGTPAVVKFLNRVAGKLRLPFELRPRFNHREEMVSMAQVSNLQHLIERVLGTKVAGAFVELGCYTGTTAAIIGALVQQIDPAREFHVYDRFDIELGSPVDVRKRFTLTIQKAGLPLPSIHQGDFTQIVPGELPPSIAFAHVDCGTGGSIEQHAALVTHCLQHVYPRLTKDAVMVFMDYYVPGETVEGNDSNPGTRLACDAFFADKPEPISLLYGGPCSHAYIRKV